MNTLLSIPKMKISRNLILLSVLLIISGSLYGQDSMEKAKEALKIASIAYMSNSFRNEMNLQPYNFINDSEGKIIGQEFHFPDEFKYYRIDLLWEEGKPAYIIYNDKRTTDGKVGQQKGELFWEGDELKRIKVNYLYRFDYNVEKRGDIIILIQNEKESSGLKIVYEAFFEDERLSKIEKYFYKGGKSILNGSKTYSSSDKTYSLHVIQSKYGKPLKTKFEINNVKFHYNEVSENTFERAGYQNGKLVEMFLEYNNQGQLVSNKYLNSNNDSIEIKYVYIENRLFQEIEIVERNKSLLNKKMTVYFDAPIQDNSKPVFENKMGRYKFDSKNDLVFESRGTKYREKINGVWSSWQQMAY